MKKLMTAVAIAALGAFALSGTSATAGNGDKVTGGGQILVGSNAGSTIAFTAQGTTTVAKGQVQFIDRTAGKGQSQVKFHGVVDCVEVDGNFGVVGGHRKGDAADRFTLRVVDSGEPNQPPDRDMVQFSGESDDARCGDGQSDDPPTMDLGRGNAQVRDGNLSNP